MSNDRESPPLGATLPLSRRLLSDLGMTVAGSVIGGVVITLVDGDPERLYEQLVYSVAIGLVAFLIIDVARLVLRDGLAAPRPWALPCTLLALPVAPVAHYTGIVIGSLVLRVPWPPLSEYPDLRQGSMILFTLLGIYSIGFFIWNRERVERIDEERVAARLRAEAGERQALQAQLRLLQAQIEPHMLFNTLANLQGLIAIDPERAGRMLERLNGYLRATLSAARAEWTTLADEFAAAEDYLALMAVRMGARLSYQCVLPDALRAVRVPAMLLQPLVENAILHGLEPQIAGGEVRLHAAVRDGRLEIAVEDTGLGLPPDACDKAGRVGLATTRERLRVQYGGQASLALSSTDPHGTLALLILPLEDTWKHAR